MLNEERQDTELVYSHTKKTKMLTNNGFSSDGIRLWIILYSFFLKQSAMKLYDQKIKININF